MMIIAILMMDLPKAFMLLNRRRKMKNVPETGYISAAWL
jgi:hypothetical protein